MKTKSNLAVLAASLVAISTPARADSPGIAALLQHPIIDSNLPLAEVRGCGMMAAVDLRGADGAALEPRRRTGYRVYLEAVRRGVLLRPIGDTLYLFPPLTVEPADVDQMVAVLEASVEAVVEAGAGSGGRATP